MCGCIIVDMCEVCVVFAYRQGRSRGFEICVNGDEFDG